MIAPFVVGCVLGLCLGIAMMLPYVPKRGGYQPPKAPKDWGKPTPPITKPSLDFERQALRDRAEDLKCLYQKGN